MEATKERKELHGHTIETLPATQDAEMCIDFMMKSYPEWVLRKSGQLDAIVVAQQRLSRAIQSGDAEEICRVRISLRNMSHLIEGRYPAIPLVDNDSPAPEKVSGCGVKLWNGANRN